jgi:hypothetical protein
MMTRCKFIIRPELFFLHKTMISKYTLQTNDDQRCKEHKASSEILAIEELSISIFQGMFH